MRWASLGIGRCNQAYNLVVRSPSCILPEQQDQALTPWNLLRWEAFLPEVTLFMFMHMHVQSPFIFMHTHMHMHMHMHMHTHIHMQA